MLKCWGSGSPGGREKVCVCVSVYDLLPRKRTIHGHQTRDPELGRLQSPTVKRSVYKPKVTGCAHSPFCLPPSSVVFCVLPKQNPSRQLHSFISLCTQGLCSWHLAQTP